MTADGRHGALEAQPDGTRRLRFRMTHEDEPAGEAMTILACDPPRRLSLSWTGQDRWEVELDLSHDGDRTELVFTQVLRSDEGAGDIAAGWHWYLDKLEAEVTGRPQPSDWDTFLADVGPAYAPPPATG